MRADVSRMPLVDALKAVACLLIVLHHLAFYGPMSDVAHPLIPGLIDWLYEYGRMAVQVFFVVAGFLLAGKLAPQGISLVADPVRAIKRRYLRLAMPYFAALALAIGCAALARNWMAHDAIPDTPDLPQLLAHALLLHDVLGQEALSAGVWYVAIDFQLFALAVTLLWLAGQIERRYPQLTVVAPVLVAGLTATSLYVFNRDESWDETAFYFFGSYGLGVLAYWASNRPQRALWLVSLGMLAAAALLVDFRPRIAVAGAVALGLGLARRLGAPDNWPVPGSLTYLGRISYSIFLVHFPLSLLVNAAFFHFFPHQPAINALGLALALCVSVIGGALFFKWVESRPLTGRARLLLPAGFVTTGLLVALGGG